MDNVTLLDAALVPIILGITQLVKNCLPKRYRVYIPGVLAFIFIPFVIIIKAQGVQPVAVFLSSWVIEGLKTAGAAVYLYRIKQNKQKGKEG
jgi:hypothetical protein